jgi:ATP:ADP antiporter, AAA family
MLPFAATLPGCFVLAQSPPSSDGVAATASRSAATVAGTKLLGIERREWPALILSFTYFFLVLAAYYVIRPVREQLSAISGSSALPLFYFATFCTTLLLTPVYGALIARYPRKLFVPAVYIFFIACLLAFIPFFEIQGSINPRVLGTVFFVWVSVFNLFVVSVFWSFMSDIFSVEQSHRLFGTISLGGGAGAIVGPLLAGVLVDYVGIAMLLAVSAGMLVLALCCIFALIAWSRRHPVERDVERNEAIIGGGILAGAKQVFASPFLRGMAILMLLGDGVGTILYALQLDLGKALYLDGVARTQFFAHVDLATNILQALLQATVTRWVLTRRGPVTGIIGVEIVKVAALAAFAAIGQPIALALAMVLTRAGAYGVEQPSRESLFTRVDRETRYKAKGFIDTAVWRFGDVVVATSMTALRAVGMTTAGFAGLAALAAASAGWIAWRLKGTKELAGSAPVDTHAS